MKIKVLLKLFHFLFSACSFYWYSHSFF